MGKKKIAILLAGLVLLGAAACGKNNNTGKPDSSKPPVSSNTSNGQTENQSSGNSGSNTQNPGQNGTDQSQQVSPDSMAKTDAEIAVEDLVAMLGLKQTDLDQAMKDVDTVGDNVSGARTYRHKLLGHDSDVSYSFGEGDVIRQITVRDDPQNAAAWKKELEENLRAKSLEDNRWSYNGSLLSAEEKDGKYLITIEKES